MTGFRKAYPGRAAGGVEGQLAACLEALKEFTALFKHRKVGAGGGIEHLVKAHAAQGGYKLARKPEEYSVGEILRCVEDNLAPVSCIKAGSVECDRAGECITVPMWMELDEIINAYLDGITLQDLLTGDKWRKNNLKG